MKSVFSILLTALFLTCLSTGFAQISVKNETYKLSNGLNVILHEDHSAPLVSVNIWYHVGSKNEERGKSGFAHLFEHLLFKGSKNVPDGLMDDITDGAGGRNNGSTTEDRTNYWEDTPSNYLENMLWIESDRMGWLLSGINIEKLDNQRDVVKNERRQRYENRPYGLMWLNIYFKLYPESHPYHWPTIGLMEDLSAASLEDVKNFFRSYYGPNNASLAIAGDINISETKKLVEKYFGEIPSGPEVIQPVHKMPVLTKEVRFTMEDKIQLPRIYMIWHSVPVYDNDDAVLDVLGAVLSTGKNSRLFKSMIFDNPIAQDATATQYSRELAGSFEVFATAKPDVGLSDIETSIWMEIEKIQKTPPTKREVDRAINGIEANFLFSIQNIGGFGGKADRLNAYYTTTGIADGFEADLARYLKVTPEDVQRVANKYLSRDNLIILSAVPEGKTDLQAAK